MEEKKVEARKLRAYQVGLVICVIAIIILGVIFYSTYQSQLNQIDSLKSQIVRKAVAYLREIAYNPDLRLCREAPRVAPNVYWVVSDNLLAFKALESYDPQLASTIRLELVKIGKVFGLPTSRDGVPLSLRYDVLIRDDEMLEMPPRAVTHITLHNGSYLLRYDLANGTNRFEDWREYADFLLLVALSNHNRGDHANAISNFTLAASMWDGIGLRDKAYAKDNAYATYKLGLLLDVSGKLGIRLPFEQDVVARVWFMQNQTSGGIFTHMTPDGCRGGSDTNTETTTFVILGVTAIQGWRYARAIRATNVASPFALSNINIKNRSEKL